MLRVRAQKSFKEHFPHRIIPHWINSQSVETENRIPVVDPTTEENLGELCEADERLVEEAVQGAQRAFSTWSRWSFTERAACLRALAEEIEKHREELALLESLDSGKPFNLAYDIEIPRSQRNFEFFANSEWGFKGESYTSAQGLHWTERSPLGVVACISPWNLPLYLLTWKLAPALIMGNCVVAKPSEVTPLTAARLAQLSEKAGFPPGVLQILQGRGSLIGDYLVSHPLIKAVSFTGSTQTGRRIAQSTAGSFKKISLEMGGKNPVLIFSDCNWSAMIDTVVRSSFQNSGQICLCGSRILVEESSASRFEKDFSEAVQDLRLGDPLDRETRMGPLVSRPHYDKVWSFLEEARRLNARFVFGGKRGAFEKGFFLQPTLLADLPDQCSLFQEEIFGPVVTLQTFRTSEEAIRLANSSTYGLAGSLWTENASRAQSIARALEVGMLWINSWMVRDLRVPFGGWKNSGFGREGGEEALRFFTEVKSLYWHQNQ